MKKADILKEKEELLKADPTRENAEAFAIAFVENYAAKQGYYDFYGTPKDEFGFCDVFKVHYRGEISGFRFTGKRGDVLTFSATGLAVTDLPYASGKMREAEQGLFAEIKERSVPDIKKMLARDLKKALQPYFPEKVTARFSVSDWELKNEA